MSFCVRTFFCDIFSFLEVRQSWSSSGTISSTISTITIRNSTILTEIQPKLTTNFHNSTQISTNTTVVGGRENSEALILMCPSEPLHRHLVRTADELKIVRLAEFLCGNRSEQVAAAALVGPEVGNGVSGIGPQQPVDDGGLLIVEHDLVVGAGDVADTFYTDEG